MALPDDFVFPEPVEDLLHMPDKPFCYDSDCSCHEEDVLTHQVYLFYLDGLMTAREAADFVAGKGI